jgi:hypothetical protein
MAASHCGAARHDPRRRRAAPLRERARPVELGRAKPLARPNSCVAPGADFPLHWRYPSGPKRQRTGQRRRCGAARLRSDGCRLPVGGGVGGPSDKLPPWPLLVRTRAVHPRFVISIVPPISTRRPPRLGCRPRFSGRFAALARGRRGSAPQRRKQSGGLTARRQPCLSPHPASPSAALCSWCSDPAAPFTRPPSTRTRGLAACTPRCPRRDRCPTHGAEPLQARACQQPRRRRRSRQAGSRQGG